jgi:hypothetical protein
MTRRSPRLGAAGSGSNCAGCGIMPADIEQVAKALECSDSKISRIETGQVGATLRDVRDMLDLYGVSDPEGGPDRPRPRGSRKSW